MKDLISLLSVSLLPVALSRPDLVPRKVGDSCTASGNEVGTCQLTSACKGMSIPGFCLNDVADVQCCVVKTCSPPGQTGVCQNTNKPCPGGSYNPGYCPGYSSIQCCPNAAAASPVTPAPNNCASPVRNTCDFYPDCLESKYHCGPDGYPLGYGLNYCRKFSAAPLSPNGRIWVSNTMLCLQKALVPYATTETTTCAALKDTAFASHPRCYVSSGTPSVCVLGPSDWEVIIQTVSLKDLFGGIDNLKAVLQTLEGCVTFYEWLIAQGIIVFLDEIGDAGKDIWHKLTDWL